MLTHSSKCDYRSVRKARFGTRVSHALEQSLGLEPWYATEEDVYHDPLYCRRGSFEDLC